MDSQRFLNRELSWIQFDARVLQEALDPRTPLLERIKFLQIFTTNLDEFFMKRVGGIKRHRALARQESAARTDELLAEIRSHLHPLLAKQYACWNTEIRPALEREGIRLLAWEGLAEDEQRWLENYFDQNLFPVLTPLAVDPGHPFPFISNLSFSLGVLLRNPRTAHSTDASYEQETLFARVKIPSTFPSWIRLKTGEDRFISTRAVIEKFLDRLFPGMEIQGSLAFRVTRNADLERDEEDAEDLLLSLIHI